jgi:hypothetical protein
MIKSISPLALAFLALNLAAQSQKELIRSFITTTTHVRIDIPNAQLDTLYWDKNYVRFHSKIRSQVPQATLDHLALNGAFNYTTQVSLDKTIITLSKQPQLAYQLQITVYLPQSLKSTI